MYHSCIADRINEFGKIHGGRETAIAYHSDSPSDLNITDLKNWPVIVITHRAYEMALDYLGNNSGIDKTWTHFQRYVRKMDYPIQLAEGGPVTVNQDGYDTRRLVIIDECLDIVEHNKASLDKLRQTLAVIPQKIRNRHPDVIAEAQKMIDLLEFLDQQVKSGKKSGKEALLWSDRSPGEFKDPGFMDLISELKDIPFDQYIGKNDLLERQRLRQIHEKRLTDLYYIHRHWAYYANHNAQHTLNAARLLIPEGTKGCVVMDATASTNKVYDLYDNFVRTPPPDGSRSYRQFRLYASRGHQVGKHHMIKHSDTVSESLIHDLRDRISPDSRVLIVCHKDVEKMLVQYLPSANWRTTHWGMVDGSNEWRNCDVVVIFGLPYMPDTWSPNMFMAFQGPQPTDWLRNDGNRPFRDFEDIRKSLKRGQLSTDTIQAMNWVRCRKVVDKDGNCEPTVGYILLPQGELADAILEDIRSMMPGIVIDEDSWKYTEQKRKVKRSNHEQSLINLTS